MSLARWDLLCAHTILSIQILLGRDLKRRPWHAQLITIIIRHPNLNFPNKKLGSKWDTFGRLSRKPAFGHQREPRALHRWELVPTQWINSISEEKATSSLSALKLCRSRERTTFFAVPALLLVLRPIQLRVQTKGLVTTFFKLNQFAASYRLWTKFAKLLAIPYYKLMESLAMVLMSS